MGNGRLLHLKLPVLRGHDSQGDYLIEAPPAAASGVEPKHTVPFLTGIFVGVAVDHCVYIGQVWGHIPLVVDQKKQTPSMANVRL